MNVMGIVEGAIIGIAVYAGYRFVLIIDRRRKFAKWEDRCVMTANNVASDMWIEKKIEVKGFPFQELEDIPYQLYGAIPYPPEGDKYKVIESIVKRR